VILIDGVKINPATIGSAALQNISPSIIDHIEIVKGPRSSVYGSEAIGGVINIITRKQVSGAHGSVRLGAGDNASKLANIDLSYGKGAISTGITLERFATDGFPVSDSSTKNHGYDNNTLNTFINYKTDSQQINLRHWQASGNVEYYSFGEQNQDYRNSSTALQWDAELSGSLKSSLRVSQILDDIKQQVANYLGQLDDAKTTRNELDAKLDYQLNAKSTLSVGILKAQEQVNALSFGTLIDNGTSIDELYALYQSTQGQHHYAISARSTDHEDFGQHNTWNFDYQYELEPAVRVYAGVGSAFRAPDSTDRFGKYGNPDLKPETSRNIELGLIVDLAEGSQFKMSAFKNRIENLIEINGAFTQMINVNEAQITGIEIGFNQQLQYWGYQLNALLQNPQNISSNEMLSRRAEARVNMLVTYQQADWQLSANTTLVSSRDDSPYSDVTLPKYAVLDLAGNYQLSRKASISAKIDNLFNEQYETAAGFNSKDRTLMLELKYNFLD